MLQNRCMINLIDDEKVRLVALEEEIWLSIDNSASSIATE